MNGALTSAPAPRRSKRRRLGPPPLPEWAQFTAVLLCVLQFCSQITIVGNIARKTAPNGDTEAYSYDGLNRATEESSRTGGNVSLFAYQYGYDLTGNVLSVAESYPSGLSNRTTTNTYDAINRLTQEAVSGSAPSSTTTYAYDNANNRMAKVVTGMGATTINYYYNDLNQLTSYNDGTRNVALGYDLNGNRVSRTVTGGSDNGADTYSYDFENRLIGLVKGSPATTGTITGTGTYAYEYDYRTRRIVRDESNAGGVITDLVFSGGSSVQEYTVAGTDPTLAVEYVRGSDYGGGVGGILYTVRGGTESYTHANRRGDIIAKTDGSDSLTYQAQYEGFGQQTATDGSTLDRQKSNSKDTDPTYLVDEGMRYRDLETGMFINRDPAGFVDGPNLYTYVIQNPWTSFDPEGLETYNQYQDDSNKKQGELDTFNNSNPPSKGGSKDVRDHRAMLQHEIDGDTAGMKRIDDLVNDFNSINAAPAGNLNGNVQITKSQRDQIDDNYSKQFVFLEAHRALAFTAGQAAWASVFTAGGEVVGAGAKAVAALRAAAPAADGAAEEAGAAGRALTDAEKATYGRVSRPAGFRQEVWDGAKSADGNVYNPDGRILKYDEPWDAGHLPGNKFSTDQIRAADEGWSRADWIKYQNDPARYRPELPITNQGHQWEGGGW